MISRGVTGNSWAQAEPVTGPRSYNVSFILMVSCLVDLGLPQVSRSGCDCCIMLHHTCQQPRFWWYNPANWIAKEAGL